VSINGVPLTVRIGTKHITREVSDISFKENAIGGIESLSLSLKRPLDRFDPDLAALSKVYFYDARSAECVAEGRLTDTGRSAAAGSGQTWEITAFGPVQSMRDETFPYILIDGSLDRWIRSGYSTRGADTTRDERDEDTPNLIVQAPEGKTAVSSGGISGIALSGPWMGDFIYRAIQQCGQKLALVKTSIQSGVTSVNYIQAIYTRTGTGAGHQADNASSSTTAATLTGTIGTGTFANGDNVASLRAYRQTSNIGGAESHYFEFWNVIARSTVYTKDGAEVVTGYVNDYVVTATIVADLVGRKLQGSFDGANATIDATSTLQVKQFAYPDGVTVEQALDDVMLLTPGYRYTTAPSTAQDARYRFSWEAWPTTVRYEVNLNDGGSFPTSYQDVWNAVNVRWVKANGLVMTTTRTLANAALTAAGITRTAWLNLGDEAGTLAQAQAAGDNFLAEHQYPSNSGTLNVSRQIRDLETGAMVWPFEIRAGELIRVRGIESYPDALNASDNDGQTVFRIWSKDYSSATNTAALELDSYSRTVANAVGLLIKKRTRRR
jgi:hypothetical protein